MIKYLIAGFAAFCITLACVTPGDIHDLAEIQETSIRQIQLAQADYQDRIEELIADVTISDAERWVQMEEAAALRNQALEETAKAAGVSAKELVELIRNRTTAIAHGAAGVVTGNPLIDLLLSTVLGAVGGAVSADKLRDHRRLVRGEAVGSTPVSSTKS